MAVAFLGPTIGVFFDGAVFGAIPTLVGRGRIAEANSYVWSLQSMIEIVAPAVIGATLAVISPAWILGFDAVSFLVSAMLLARIARPMWDASRARDPMSVHVVVRDVREGLSFLVGHEGVRSMTIVGTLMMVSIGGYMALTVVWLDRVLGLGTEGWRFGVTYVAWAIGGLAASLAVPRLVRFVAPARITLVAVPFAAGLGVVTSRVTTWWVAALLYVGWAAAVTMVVVNSISYRQAVTPEHLQGRVNTAGRMLSWGIGWTGGALLSGILVGPLGLRPDRVGLRLGGGARGGVRLVQPAAPDRLGGLHAHHRRRVGSRRADHRPRDPGAGIRGSRRLPGPHRPRSGGQRVRGVPRSQHAPRPALARW